MSLHNMSLRNKNIGLNYFSYLLVQQTGNNNDIN